MKKLHYQTMSYMRLAPGLSACVICALMPGVPSDAK